MAMSESDVKKLAKANDIPTYQPESLKLTDVFEKIQTVGADVMIVVAYGQIIPKSILVAFPLGCINVHASLLPRWRGAAPIQRAIMAGDKETGVTIMRMAEGLDTGPIFCEQRVEIGEEDTSGTLHTGLAALGGEALLRTLSGLNIDTATRAQDDDDATYAHKINNTDALIDWTRSCVEVSRLVRAMNPVPGAYTFLDGARIKVWKVSIQEKIKISARPGTIIELDKAGFTVVCGFGAVGIHTVQKSGGVKSPAVEYARAIGLQVGMSLDSGEA
jgi:methionyl-tRNA formyltransferase